VNLFPWDYMFVPFNRSNFHDIFTPIVAASVIWLLLIVVLYNVRTRRLRNHAPYVDMYEWLLWTGLITFSLVIIYAIFVFDFFFVPITLAIGLATLVWIRFIRFPPIFEIYELKLAKQRYYSRSKFAHPESTIRPKTSRRAAAKQVRVAPSKRSRKRR
jgi:hypothetical protein